MNYFPGEFIRGYYRADDGGPCDGWIPAEVRLSPGEAIDLLKQTRLDDNAPDLAHVVRLAVNDCLQDVGLEVAFDSNIAHELVRLATDFGFEITQVDRAFGAGSNMDALHSMISFKEKPYN